MKMNETEREIFEHGLEAAKKRLIIAQRAREGSAIRESVVNIKGRIEYLKKALEEDDKKTE